MLRKNIFAIIWLTLFQFLSVAAHAADVTFPTTTLAIKTHDGTIPFAVEVATSNAQHEQG